MDDYTLCIGRCRAFFIDFKIQNMLQCDKSKFVQKIYKAFLKKADIFIARMQKSVIIFLYSLC